MESRDLVRILWAVLYFVHQLFSAFYRLVCKIANLGDIDLEFSGSISDVNSDNIVKWACLEVLFLKIVLSRILVCNLHTGSVMSKFIFDFVLPYRCQNLVNISLSYLCVVFEISGGVSTPQMPLSCQSRYHLTVNGSKLNEGGVVPQVY